MVELVPANGHAANGNGHHEAEEPQRPLFSWSEFMAEPVKPTSPKAQAPSLSLFEWAVEQETQPIGLGR